MKLNSQKVRLLLAGATMKERAMEKATKGQSADDMVVLRKLIIELRELSKELKK